MLPEIHEDTRRGTYALILRALERRRIRIGRFGWLTARKGYYVYVGSAFGAGGLGGRLRHHLHPARASHWHIDFLRKAAAPIEVWYSHDSQPLEHQWAAALRTMPGSVVPLRRFGASDCKCEAHLFFFEAPPVFSEFRRRVCTS